MINDLKNLVYTLDKLDGSCYNLNKEKLKQGDIRNLEIHVFEDGEELNLENYNCLVKWVNANGTLNPLVGENVSTSGNVVHVELNDNCTKSAGTAKWELVINKGTKVDFSYTREVEILPSVEMLNEASKNLTDIWEQTTKAEQAATDFINRYGNLDGIKEKVDELDNTKAEQRDLDAVDARIDSFTHLAAGSTTGDAELIDARIGANGMTYKNAGDSIREQNNDINDLIEYISDGRALANLINKNNITDNKVISGDGSIEDRDGVSYTNSYLFLHSGKKITINFDAHATIVVYNLDKTFNKRVTTDVAPFTYTAENNCYIRFNIYTAKVNEAIAIIGENIPDVFMYKNILIPKRIKKIKNRSLEGSFLFCGDSICVGFGAEEKGGYSKLIAKNNPNMSYKNIAVSGATFGRRPNTNPGTSILDEIENEIST
ncbi:MAG: hypothetical protein PUE01_00325, partial [Clostridiaceae bacterium]|nr:hypothetical protein [Clostridiaceae bacterium]